MSFGHKHVGTLNQPNLLISEVFDMPLNTIFQLKKKRMTLSVKMPIYV